jgi:integrase
VIDTYQTYLDHLAVTAKPASLTRAGASIKQLRATPEFSVDRHTLRRRQEGAKDTTINAELRTWRAALRYSGDLRAVKLLKEVRKIPTIITEAQELRLLATPMDYRVRIAIQLALNAGLRHQEIRHLRFEDTSRNKREIAIRAWGGWSPKSHAERIIPMNLKLYDALSYTFTKVPAEGEPFVDISLYVPIRKIFESCGIRTEDGREGLHMLRRTFASRLLERGADINTVRELMGHADLATTQRYLVSSGKQKRAAVALLEG